MMNRILLWAGVFILVLLLAVGGFYLWIQNAVATPYGNAEYPVTFAVTAGSSPSQIAKLLADKGLISSEWVFLYEVRREEAGPKLQAGIFTFGEPLSMPQVIKKLMTEGRLPPTKVLVPEGRTAREIGMLLSYLRGFDGEKYRELALNSKDSFQFKFSKTIKGKSLEGYLYPDTYLLDDVSAEGLVRCQLKEFEQIFTSKFEKRCKELGLSVHELVTLASIIERESGTTEEMKNVSSVFWNRLKAGWKLESCVTVGYVLEKPSVILTLKELAVDSPYNTYKYPGLPPGPVCNPGLSAIEAALWPAKTNYFFFVATGKGYNDFSETIAEHNQKVAKYLKNGLR